MGVLKQYYLEKSGAYDLPSNICPECERETEDPGSPCFSCQFDQKMEEDD